MPNLFRIGSPGISNSCGFDALNDALKAYKEY